MTVLITGANRGIGRGLFDHYSAEGTDTIGTSRAGSAHFLQLDVTDLASHRKLTTSLDKNPIDLLVCNAGVYLDKQENLDTGFPAEMWATTFAANVAGVFHTVQTLLPNLRAAKNPRIAIISSQMATHASAKGNSYIYRASKAASLNLGYNLAAGLRDENIAVGIYHPGWVVTDMGGGNADLSIAESVAGLIQRFDELSMETTGCFLNWDGTPQSY